MATRTITGDKVTIPLLCVKPGNAYVSIVEVSDDNGKTWRGLGVIPATFGTTTYANVRTVTNYRLAEDAFFAGLDAKKLPYERCRDHVKCDVNTGKAVIS